MSKVRPILPGFYPDPSICRVGADFYLVNSSFEYFPGVPLWHSRNLRDWRQIGHVLDRPSLLQLPAGTKPSDGIYAPTLRYNQGRFFMVTTQMPEPGNFLVHTTDPAGPWSEPVKLAQRGIDPSLFFDTDGRCYLTSNGTFWAPVRGAYQCEINPLTGEQLTPSRFLWAGTGGSYPEAPHVFKRGEFYYLLLAEGGTAECHMVTIARSRDPYGPFESCPHNPILTHRSLMCPVQGTAHADFVEDADGQWWAVFLGYRYSEHGFHPLGRETFIASVTWTQDHWPVVNDGQPLAPLPPPGWATPPAPKPAIPPPAPPVQRDDFDAPRLGLDWVFCRTPDAQAVSLSERTGCLTLRCLAPSPDDLASFAGVLRRQRDFVFRASTALDFNPAHNNEEAGLIVMMDNLHHYEIALTFRAGVRSLVVRRRIGSLAAEVACVPAPDGVVTLLLEADRARYRLGFIAHGVDRWIAEGEVRYLCTEVTGGYNGIMLGIYATARGVTDSPNRAHVDWFDYAPAADPS